MIELLRTFLSVVDRGGVTPAAAALHMSQAAASQQIASGNTDLSQRTEQQAASLEATVDDHVPRFESHMSDRPSNRRTISPRTGCVPTVPTKLASHVFSPQPSRVSLRSRFVVSS